MRDGQEGECISENPHVYEDDELKKTQVISWILTTVVLVMVFSSSFVFAQPVAKIKAIFVNDVPKDSVNTSEIEVFRNNNSIPVTKSMLLMKNDRVVTHFTARVILLYLLDSAETDKEVFMRSNDELIVRDDKSIFQQLGEAFYGLKGFFDTVTPDAIFAASGTEFTVQVAEDGTSTVVVFSGYVNVRRQSNSLFNNKGQVDVLPVAYSPPNPEYDTAAEGFQFVVFKGTKTTLTRQVRLVNNCQNRHKFEIRRPDFLEQMDISNDDAMLNPQQEKTLESRFEIDAKELRAGVYSDYFTVDCEDCAEEPDCKGYTIPFDLIVNHPGTFTVGPLQEVTTGGTAGAQIPKPTTEQKVRSIVNWTNEMILDSQPTYSSKGVIPHYSSVEERSQAFRQERFNAIWRREPGSWETLGNIYTDWGSGAKAVDAFNKEVRIDPSKENSVSFLTSLSEANRQTGRLDRSEYYLKQALAIDPENGAALNGLGNVYLDRANIARDIGDMLETQSLLEQAETNFTGASRSLVHEIEHGRFIAQTNLGEAKLVRADIARQAGRLDDAEEQYRSAERLFNSSQRAMPQYPFNMTGIGRAYNGLREVSLKRGDDSSASAAFQRSEQKYKEAIELHADMGVAYVGLGNLYKNLGRKQEAIASFKRATQVRPEDPTPYFHLGELLEQQDRKQAAQYFSTYLQLQRKDFMSGERASKAMRVAGIPPPPPVKVPDVEGKRREEAVRRIIEAGLMADVQEQEGCRDFGEVVAQDPKEGKRVSKGSRVQLTVAVPGAIIVPRLEGGRGEEAERSLREVGLHAEIRKRPDLRPEGTVIDQDPKAGTRVASRCTVKVTVAVPIMVSVPTFIGQTEEKAREALTGVRSILSQLYLGEVTYQPSRHHPGIVIDQYPKPGSMVPAGTRVNLVVSQSYEDIDSPGR